MVLEKSAKGGLGIVMRISFFEDLVVVRAAVSVVKNLESFIDLMEPSLCLLLVALVALGQPLMG
jgi:hypothetical protein